jgi:hypothetical protein
MPNKNEGKEKRSAFSSLRELQSHQQSSNAEALRDKELEQILMELGGKLTDLFPDINPETLVPNIDEYTDDEELQATASLLRVALSTFIEDCKKISTIIQIYQKMNERNSGSE